MLKHTYTAFLVMLMLGCIISDAQAQLDPMERSIVHLGYDQSFKGQGPQAAYAFYYYNDPDFLATNKTLRLVIAPVYLDGELGFKQLISPNTDFGIGFNGGGFSDNFYEVRQGHYYKEESFDGHAGGLSVNAYHRLNPDHSIPLSFVARTGFRYSIFDETDRTAGNFTVPSDNKVGFVRTGLRFAGKEPVLYPDLGLEVSLWYERQQRFDSENFGYAGERPVKSHTDLYWVYAGLNYGWTNTGHHVSFSVTAAGSSSADRFSAWRLGSVLPLGAEYPLILPGYYYQELTAERFVHLHASYMLPLSPSRRWQFRAEVASAAIDYLDGFAQPDVWQTGAGAGIAYSPESQSCRVVLRYGYGFNAIRGSDEGAHSVGLLFQYDFKARKRLAKARE
ncbi:MAG TPA: hypothetical protein VGH19_12420 [Verrucomicrobiae bacterium]